ncbi:hypothetical protein M1145_02605 [Patescibacteria group bacterium]|nr:hypothetical protein [Patescibacteria group bacterium]
MNLETDVGQEENNYPSNEVLKDLFENLSTMADEGEKSISDVNSNSVIVIQSREKRKIIFRVDLYNSLAKSSEYPYPHSAKVYILKKSMVKKNI